MALLEHLRDGRRIRFPQGPITRLLRHVLEDRLTDPGRVFVWVILFSMATGGVTLQIQIYLIFCVVACMFAGNALLARLARTDLDIDAPLPAHSTAGATLSVPVVVHNRSKWPAFDAGLREIALPHGVEARPAEGLGLPPLAAGATVTVARQLVFPRRGAYTMEGLRQETLFPFGLWKDIVDHRAPQTVLVYPRFHALTSLDIPTGARHQPGGIALTSNLGDSIEFIGTREYREGDSLRAIHWKTWARLGKPAVKEFQEEYFCRIALLMDTFMPAPRIDFLGRAKEPPERRAFEAAVSLAAAVADALSREEYIIDIFAAGPELYHLQSGRSLAYLENVLDILACLEPCHEKPFEKMAPIIGEHLENLTTTIVILLDWDEAREAMVRSIRDHGSAVKLIIVRDGPTTLDVAGADALCQGVQVVGSDEEAAGIEAL